MNSRSEHRKMKIGTWACQRGLSLLETRGWVGGGGGGWGGVRRLSQKSQTSSLSSFPQQNRTLGMCHRAQTQADMRARAQSERKGGHTTTRHDQTIFGKISLVAVFGQDAKADKNNTRKRTTPLALPRPRRPAPAAPARCRPRALPWSGQEAGRRGRATAVGPRQRSPAVACNLVTAPPEPHR